MSKPVLRSMLEMARDKTLKLVASIEAQPNAQAVLAFRPGPGRAHIGWQLMHIAATDDRHLHARMRGGQPREPEFVKRFAGGSTPDDNVPSLAQIRSYLETRRAEMLQHFDSLDESAMAAKPNEQAPWKYYEWFQVLAWHEAHHHGQAHLSFNLYKAANPGEPSV